MIRGQRLFAPISCLALLLFFFVQSGLCFAQPQENEIPPAPKDAPSAPSQEKKAAPVTGGAAESRAGATAFPFSQPLVMETEDERLVRWDLTADKVITLNDSEIMEATGNVYLKRGNEYLKADFARYYMSTKWVFLKGNVIVRSGKDEIKAEEAEFDLRSRVGWLKNGRIFMSEPHTYIAGEHINKHWGDVYTFKQAKITTCDGDVPAWSFTADEAVVEIDGYARLSKSSFQVADTPVMYAPFFIVPVKTSRQTGLLMPEYGKSTTKGVYYNQPFFWAINESSDLTVNEYFMEKRGFMHGLQYRATPNSDTKIWLRGDMMWDKKRDLTDTGDYSGDGLIRNNYERYWLRGMLDTRLPNPNWRLKADIDYVSDQYFLREFNNGMAGFDTSRNELAKLFGRDLQEKTLDRISGLLLTRDWERFSLALSATYSQDQTLGNGNRARSQDETVQSLPQLDAFLYKGRLISWLPLEVEANAQAAYFYRRKGTSGARYEVVPRMSLPINTRYGSVIASAGLYQTLYDSNTVSDTPFGVQSWGDTSVSDRQRQTGESRTIPEFNVAGFTEFAKVYPLGNSAPLALTKENIGKNRWVAMRHSIQPRVEFRQRANENQDDNPWYTSEDRLAPKTELVYSVTNVITTKRNKVVLTKDENGEMVPTQMTDYADLVRLRLEQSYDFREATRNQSRDEYSRRPYSDILAELTVYPWDNISLTTKNNWSPYLGEITRHQSGVTFNFPDYGWVYAGYDMRRAIDEYTRKNDRNISYLRFDVGTAQFGAWSLNTSVKYDYKDTSNQETDIDLVYNHQCFKIIGRVSVDPQEENYQLLIMLTGLGG